MPAPAAEAHGGSGKAGPTSATRTEKRKKERRRRDRREAVAAAVAETDPEEERRLLELKVAQAAEESERARQAFEDAERRWLAAEKAAAAEEEARAAEASSQHKSEEDGECDYVENGPAETIWQGNEITVKKKKVKVPKGIKEKPPSQEEERHTSSPFPPQSVSVVALRRESSLSAQEVLEKVGQETPNFVIEQT